MDNEKSQENSNWQKENPAAAASKMQYFSLLFYSHNEKKKINKTKIASKSANFPAIWVKEWKVIDCDK